MDMILPTVLVLLFTALIGWALFALIARLEKMSGGGQGQPRKEDERQEQ